MAQRDSDDYGTPRSGAQERDDRRYGGSRSNIYDEPPLEERNRDRGRSRHSLRDDDVPEVRFGRNTSDRGFYGSEGNLSDFRDRTSRGPLSGRGEHSGYGDYTQEDYYYGTHRGAGGGEYGGRGDYGQGSYGNRDLSDTDFNRTQFGRSSLESGARDFGTRGYGRRDYRGNVGPGGYGYAEANYGPGRSSRGGGQDWSANERSSGARYGSSGSQAGYSQFGAGSQGSMAEQYGPGATSGESGRFESHRGRGPKGYTRSDDRLKEMLCEQLTEDPGIDASEITITVFEGIVTLDGTVDDRWTKYQVEEMAGNVGGVKDVRNQLRVQSPGGPSSSSQSGQGSQQNERAQSTHGAGSSTSGASTSRDPVSGGGSSASGDATGSNAGRKPSSSTGSSGKTS